MPVPSSQDTTSEESDAVLAERVRAGDSQAFALLWTRHAAAADRAAQKITRRFDSDDLVQEAFARVLSALRAGDGPRGAFRPYLYAVLRNVSMNWARDRGDAQSLDDLTSWVDPDSMFEDPALARTITTRAFSTLRPEWRSILWYTEVEGVPAREAAPYLGLSPNATAALAYRAREGLRTAWLQAHVQAEESSGECRWVLERIGAYQRAGLSRRDTNRAENHLKTCASCSLAAAEISDLSNGLRSALLPLVFGAGTLDAVVAVAGTATSAAAPVDGVPAGSGSQTSLATVTSAGGSSAASAIVAVLATVAVAIAAAAGVSALSNRTQQNTAIAPTTTPAPELRRGDGETTGPTAVPGGTDEGSSDGSGPTTPERLQTPKPSAPETSTRGTGAESEQRRPPSDRRVPAATEPPRATDTDVSQAPGPADPAKPGPEPTESPSSEPTVPPSTGPDPASELSAPVVRELHDGGLYLPTIHGTGAPGAAIVLVDQSGVPVGRSTADSGGRWAATLDDHAPLTSGTMLRAQQESGGVTSPFSNAIGPLPLRTPTILGIAERYGVILIALTGQRDANVQVLVDGEVVSVVRVTGAGPEVLVLHGLQHGHHRLTVRYLGQSPKEVGASREEILIVERDL